MISDRQLEANRANALKSTGPRTAEGKAHVAANAIRHGLLSELRILPGLEEVEHWQYHMEQTLADMEPEGHMECLLAERIALVLWRLARTARYEQESAAAGLENAEQRLLRTVPAVNGREREERGEGPTPLEAADERVAAASETVDLLNRLRDLPEDEVVPGARKLIQTAREIADLSFATSECSGQLEIVAGRSQMENLLWSARELLDALGVLAESGGLSFDQLYAKLTAWAGSALSRTERQRGVLNSTLDQYRRLSLLPDGEELAKITRYEAHLERMLSKAMHELQRRQAMRLGRPVPLPLVVDVTGGGPFLDA
jgi:hypothetical protein